MQLLQNTPFGKKQVVKWVTGTGIQKDLLEQIGIRQGEEIEVVASYFGNTIVSVHGIRYALGTDVAERIRI